MVPFDKGDKMEELKGKRIDVLDKGFVELVDYMGSDELIVNAARVSYGGKKKNSDKSLIEYLIRNDHTSPFEMVEFIFRIKVPIFVARQIFRHRTASFNEISGRYTVYEEEFFVPKDYRKNTKKNRQSSEVIDILDENLIKEIKNSFKGSFALYKKLLDYGLARELARVVLPLSTYTLFYYKQDLKNLLHFLKLRLDYHAQKEIREVANAMLYFVKQVVPITWEAFEKYKLKKVEITEVDLQSLPKEKQNLLMAILEDLPNYLPSSTRKEELISQLDTLFGQDGG